MRAPEPVPPEALEALAQLVESRSGLRFAESRRSELASKAGRVFADSGCATWPAYLRQIASPAGAPLLRQLVEALTVGETYFFRHRPYFEILEREVLPQLIAQRRPTRQLRLWSAGCATGEEAYSLAILVRRLLPDIDQWQVSILATDLNLDFLARAEAGLYGEWSFRETDEAFKAAYFRREGLRYRVRSQVHRLVRFARLNLVEDWSPSAAAGTADLDLILCRNVLMYFAPEVADRVLTRLRAALVPGGWLVLGPSDGRLGGLVGFELHTAPDAVLYRRAEGQHPEPRTYPSAPPPDMGVPATAGRLPRTSNWPGKLLPAVAPPGKRLPAGEPARSRPVAMGSRAARPSGPEAVAAAHASEADWRAAWRTARASADRGHFEEAEAHCRQAAARAAGRPEPYYLLGMLHQAQGDDAGALVAFRKALYLDRTFVPVHLALAAVYRRAGRPEQARQALARAQRHLEGRAADELVLAEDGLTVGRLRDALSQALNDDRIGRPG